MTSGPDLLVISSKPVECRERFLAWHTRRGGGRQPSTERRSFAGVAAILELRNETDTTYQQNATYDTARVQWVRLHPEPAEMVDKQRGN